MARRLDAARLAQRPQLARRRATALTAVVPSSMPRSSAHHVLRSRGARHRAPSSAAARSGSARPRPSDARRRARRCPSDAVRPVERIAATLIELRARARAPDHVVHAAPGGPQPRVARRSARRPRARAAARPPSPAPRARLGPHAPVALVVLVDRGGPGDDLAVERGEDEHALRALRRAPAAGCGRARSRGRRRRTRPCAGRSRTMSSPARRATSSAWRPAQLTVDASRRETGAALVCTRTPVRISAPHACGRGGERERVARRDRSPTRRGPRACRRRAADRHAVGRRPGDELRRRRAPARPQRRTGTPSASSTGSRSCGRTQDQLASPARRASSRSRCAGSPSSCRWPQREASLGLQQHDVGATARQRERDRGAHDAAADDRDVVHFSRPPRAAGPPRRARRSRATRVRLGMPLHAECEAQLGILERLRQLVVVRPAAHREPVADASMPWWWCESVAC